MHEHDSMVQVSISIVCSRSLGSRVGLTEPFKIKVLSTYVFYVTIVILRNMRTQLLTFQNGVLIQDSYSRAITWFYQKKIVPGTLKSLL